MSVSPLRPAARRGFTLIELLVVVSIIAILAAIAFPVTTGVMKAAKRAKAAATCNSVATGVMAYYTEYSTYPMASSGSASDFKISGGSASGQWADLAACLNGNRNPYNQSDTSTGFNKRNIVFVSFKKNEVTTGGVPFVPLSTFDDPYYYAIVMDSDYDETVEPISGNKLGEGVAVWMPESSDLDGTKPLVGTFKKQ